MSALHGLLLLDDASMTDADADDHHDVDDDAGSAVPDSCACGKRRRVSSASSSAATVPNRFDPHCAMMRAKRECHKLHSMLASVRTAVQAVNSNSIRRKTQVELPKTGAPTGIVHHTFACNC